MIRNAESLRFDVHQRVTLTKSNLGHMTGESNFANEKNAKGIAFTDHAVRIARPRRIDTPSKRNSPAAAVPLGCF